MDSDSTRPAPTPSAPESATAANPAGDTARVLDRRRIGDTNEQHRLVAEAMEAADRLARLQAVTAGLARALTPEEVARTVVREGMAAYQAADGILCLTSDDGQWLEIVGAVGLPDRTTEEFRRFRVDGPFPLSEAVRVAKPLFFENKAAMQARYPELREANQRATTESWIALPLVAENRAIGGLAFGFNEERAFGTADRALAVALAQQCVIALERARLYTAERDARHEADLARQRADEANRIKTEFLAVMSHELRTPLNAIAGYAELLDLGVHGPLSDAQREAVGRIQRSQRHLLGLINDVLNFARIDAGHVEVQMTAVPVADALAALEALVAPEVRRKQLGYSCGGCDATIAAVGDAEKLQQVLLNLVSNAIKFTDAGGRVTVGCDADDDTVWIAVRDTGHGIPADKLERIFEPFVQLDSGLARSTGGTGLGLAISRDLARAMGGDITVASEPSVGSTFTVRLQRTTEARVEEIRREV